MVKGDLVNLYCNIPVKLVEEGQVWCFFIQIVLSITLSLFNHFLVVEQLEFHLIEFVYVLHLYETFGWWRRANYLKVQFVEIWNEMHHLLIMEISPMR
ncbi:hypothetical protein MKX01_000263 [Papaver californicum]|nr:hypothetical protein MKX01_000263 [Papaver californicum]